ncbi:NAD(P)/FAD-dependent oxidoreductase [Streptomyces roseolus]|uniref:NAD(P)/FAD-dependent oxidoreductase n=1 Tax=Streptomyces roseolus TaxID=67358 RepID=UPI003793F0F8
MTTSPSDPAAGADLAIVGAGPAGLAAAVTAAALGLTVTLLDAGARPGGQYYRHPDPALGATRPQALHHDWEAFAGREAELRAYERAGRVRYAANRQVWSVTGSGADWTVHSRTDDEAGRPVRARAVLLATGAYERQLPFPGWTLPGVVGAGGAQAMLKSGLVLPGTGAPSARAKPRARGRVVVAGSGPLLLAVAASLAAAGARVPAVVEAAGYGPYARHAGTLLRNPAKLAEGARYGGALLRHQVRPLLRHAVVEAHGTGRVEAVTVARLDRDWRPVPGTGRRVPCDALAVGHGLVPELSLATALGCATRTAADGTAALVLTPGLRTSVPGVWAAGETGGIGGAQLALTEGEIAAHSIAGRPVPAPLARRRARLRAFADAMGAAHRPGGGWTGWLREDTAVCRCEEVPAGRVREAVEELGATDARTVKLLTRAGMGWCQGRVCGPAVAALAGGGPAADRRPLACPVRLGELAELPAD